MSLTRSEFFGPSSLARRVNNLFHELENSVGYAYPESKVANFGTFGTYFPALDVHNGEKEITVKADLPGFKKEEIKLDIHGNRLVISGENKQDNSYEKNGWEVRERKFGSFERAILLPEGIDEKNIKANYKDGVLEVVVGKVQAAQVQKKAIEIR